MLIDIQAHLVWDTFQPTDHLLQIEVPDFADQRLISARIDLPPVEHFARVFSEDAMGERIWLRSNGRVSCDYSARIEVDRPVLNLTQLDQVPPHLLPGDCVRYLMPSRFCPSDEFRAFVAAEFGEFAGGARIAAMRDWIESAFAYIPGSSTDTTTALDTFVQRQGVCRDFAHVLITLARASAIPARFASVYAPDVTPQDFHAVAEIYLDGTWHLVDPTGMARADTMARIGIGMDAAEVAFLSSFGLMQMAEQWVTVFRAAA